ncbi:MAG TPA: GDP-fucose synthetase [Rhodospirillaceae bacterium]|jgi:GDP-L-fucose synthase|nr:GDP-L-fucose synthase [Alphaproteobacteria bacterium]HBH26905.1 GDP-fucose synthetase [Rhodospirillaceae bacterium]
MAADVFPLSGKRVYVAGHSGLVGAALCRRLEAEGCTLITPARADLDLTRQDAVERFLARHAPDAVVVAAARVGGIGANMAAPADFIRDNLAIAGNLIHGAHITGVHRLLFLGSSCMYPRGAAQPMAESALLSGPPEPTNAPYALAKLAGAQMVAAYRAQHGRAYITAIPCNLYGPGDRFDEAAGHVIPALMARARRLAAAGEKTLPIWGTGAALREFLHADDLARALALLLARYDDEPPVNVGSCGQEVTIAWLAEHIADLAGLTPAFDATRPDGAPRKVVDCARIRALGWAPRIPLEDGLAQTWDWFTGHP